MYINAYTGTISYGIVPYHAQSCSKRFLTYVREEVNSNLAKCGLLVKCVHETPCMKCGMQSTPKNSTWDYNNMQS